MIISDSYFVIGDMHIRAGKPCQDYAISKVLGNRAIAIVCDGCSSGGLTDTGARLLAHTMLRSFTFIDKDPTSPTDLRDLRQAVTLLAIPNILEEMYLSWNDLLTTLVYTQIETGNNKIVFFGDGAAVVDFGNHIEFYQIKFDSGAPYYYIYKSNMGAVYNASTEYNPSNAYKDYIELQKDKPITLSTHKYGNTVIIDITPEKASRGITINLPDDIVAVTIFSDGVTSFSNTDWIDVCKELTSFKNIAGEYLKRRMIKGIQEYSKHGIKIMDDTAGASLYNIKE